MKELLALAVPMYVDAKYLAASVERFKNHAEVHISRDGAGVMLKNYQMLLEVLDRVAGKGAAATPAIEHPTSAEKPSLIQELETLRVGSLERLERLNEGLIFKEPPR